MKKVFCFINGKGPDGVLEAISLSEDGKIIDWCFSEDEEKAKKLLLNRRIYPEGHTPIWVYDKSIDVGYKKAVKKYEEVNHAKPNTRK